MKVLLLSDTYSEHTEKWALGLASSGLKIGLFSFNKASYEWYNHKNITVFFEPEHKINAESTLTKLAYLKYVSVLKKIIKHFQPDILHAHYATSYGLIGAMSGFSPFILSVWGSDVYDFPRRSKFHKKILQFNLKKADLLMSTSIVMKEELKRYTKQEILVTPFGVDTTIFCKKDNKLKVPGTIYIGTIKPIEEKYGIVHIISAAKLVIEGDPHHTYKFMLIGGGSNLNLYQSMIDKLNLTDYFEITGRIPFVEISNYHNLLDIFLNVSIDDSESFGVAAVEAMACEKPVIVTDVGGLLEVVNHGEYGLVVKKGDPSALATAIRQLVDDRDAAQKLGEKARQNVLTHYDWRNNLQKMISAYENLLEKKQTPVTKV
jgi:glycosyltransferase involved in cell wall biosynthesis